MGHPERGGDGIHLIAIAVDDREKAGEELKAKGARIIDAPGGPYIHPADSHGVLIQLVERD